MSTLNVRLPNDLEDALTREADLARKPRSELAREAIRAHLERLERERFLGELTRAAHTIAEDPALRRETERIGEAFAAADAEIAAREEPAAGTYGTGDNDQPWWA